MNLRPITQAPVWKFFSRTSRRSISLLAGEEAVLKALEDVPIDNMRNFSIIAHVDHGKSTLADKMLELCGNIPPTNQRTAQVLDTLQVERERGITVKAQTVSIPFRRDGEQYLLNLIDTPGHVDFASEVSRSLAACQGALLLVDCAQGVQAQTVANYHAAVDCGLDIVPVLTKIDLPNADPEPVLNELYDIFRIDPSTVVWTSAKSGAGVNELFPAVVDQIRAPTGSLGAPLRCRLFDSWYDRYRGVICQIEVVDGMIAVGDIIVAHSSGTKYIVQEVGVRTPRVHKVDHLRAGQVGYIIAGMKTTAEAKSGDTIHHHSRQVQPLPGFANSKPMVFASVYPVDLSDFEELSKAVEKLTLNDSSVVATKESNPTLGMGLRCGFLGVLHMDVFFQRLQQEFSTPVISTAPMVPYVAVYRDGEELAVERPSDLPAPHEVKLYKEPMAMVSTIVPADRMSVVLSKMFEARGEQEGVQYLDDGRVLLRYKVPWQEIVNGMFDHLKSITSGYATFDYEPAGYQVANIVRVDVLLNGQRLDALSFVCHKDKAQTDGRRVALRLKEVIRRQQFEVIIQATINNKPIARERIPPFRKDVLTKAGKTVGGGDISRKKKLLEKQKLGKARLKTFANIELSQEAFHSVLSTNQK